METLETLVQRWILLLDQKTIENDKLLIVNSLNPIIHKVSNDTMIFGLYNLLKVATEEKWTDLVLSSLQTIHTIVSCLDSEKINDILPGLLSQLVKHIVKFESKLHHRIIQSAFDVIQCAIVKSTTFDDQKLNQVFQLLTIFRFHPNSKVAVAFLHLSGRIVQVYPQFTILVSNLICGIQLDREVSMNYIETFRSMSTSFDDLILEFDDCCKSAYSVILSSNESEKNRVLALIYGYLQFPEFVSWLSLEHLIKALVRAAVFNFSDVKILTNRTITHKFEYKIEDNMHRNTENFVRFLYLQESDLLFVKKILQCLGSTKFVDKIVSTLLESVDFENSSTSTSSLYCLNLVLSGAVDLPDSNVESIIHRLVNLNALKYPSSQAEKASMDTLEPLNVEILFYNQVISEKCLILECFGVLSTKIHGNAPPSYSTSKSFRMQFMWILYPLLEGLGDVNDLLHDCALQSLNAICSYTSYDSIVDLIKDNMDYILNTLSFRIKFLKMNPFSPKVLYALVSLLKAEIVVYFKDIMLELMDCLDKYKHSDYAVSSIVRVYRQLVKNCFTKKCIENTSHSSVSLALRRFYESKMKRMEPEVSDEPEKIDLETETLVNLLEKSEYLMSNSSENLRLDIERLAVELLSVVKPIPRVIQWCQRVLPLLFQRLKFDVDHIYMIEAHLDLLTSIVKCCGEFFSTKHLNEDILPIFNNWLSDKKPTMKEIKELSNDLLGKTTKIKNLPVAHVFDSQPRKLKWIDESYSPQHGERIAKLVIVCIEKILESVDIGYDLTLVHKIYTLVSQKCSKCPDRTGVYEKLSSQSPGYIWFVQGQ